MSDITAIIVNFNSGDRLAGLIKTLEGDAIPTVIVDNASRDRSLDGVTPTGSINLIRNDENRGFASAANQGAEKATTEWILFVNPDVELKPGQALDLVTNLPESVALAAPLQTSATGIPLAESAGYDPTLVRFAHWVFTPARLQGRRGPWLAPPFPTTDVNVDWVSGAMLAVRSTAFRELGGFDERFFLFQEDVDLCRRTRAVGRGVILRGSQFVHHEVGQGGEQRRNKIRAEQFVASLGHQFEGWRRIALGAVLLAGFGLRAFRGGARGQLARAAMRPCFGLLLGR